MTTSKRTAIAALAAMLVAFAGASAGVAVISGTTGTVVACATSPAQTISDNGTPIATVPQVSACSTATYTVSTITTTVGTTTASPTFASETAYTSHRPAFTPTRIVGVSTASAFKSALSSLQAGDLVKATAPFTVTGETTLTAAPSARAELELAGVSFVYNGGQNLPAIFISKAANLYIYGGDLSTSDTGGTCLLVHGASRVLWWGFTVHDCGGHGVFVAPVGAGVDRLDIEGTITKVGQNLAWDPHAEKGTGLHGALLWDSGNTLPFTNNRFAFDEYGIPVGACVEVGNSVVAPAGGNTLLLRCLNETEVSTRQTGGAGLEVWGDSSSLGLGVRYLEVGNAQGRALDGSGVYSGQSLTGVSVAYGRASNTNLNKALNEPSPALLWYPVVGPVYGDVLPVP